MAGLVYGVLIKKSSNEFIFTTSRSTLDTNIFDSSLHCIMMEHISGENIYEYLENLDEDVLERDEIYNISRQICHGVNKIHEKDILHLDIKLENIMYDAASKKIKIIDFGESVNNNSHKGLSGTDGTRAPEVYAGGKYGGKADDFSVGASLFDFLCGSTPDKLYAVNNVKEFKGKEVDDIEFSTLTSVGYMRQFALLSDVEKKEMINNILIDIGFNVDEYTDIVNVIVGLTRYDQTDRMSSIEAYDILSDTSKDTVVEPMTVVTE